MPADGSGPLTRPDETVIAALVAELTESFGDRVSTAMAVREHHARDFSFHDLVPADAVVMARSTDEVVEIVKACAKHNVPIIPFGTGTSAEGHLAALHGGICVDVSEMNSVLEVNAEDMDVTVEPGVTRKQLNEYLRDTGLFFPIDPGADASIGGMAATRASGTNAVRYGTMRENVLSLEVVTSDGRVIRTARRARKSSSGYDLTRLFVGSEGTLGIITKVTLKLFGIPEAISSAVVSFDSLAGAVDAVIATIQWGIPMARIELLDDVQMDAINKYADLDYPIKPTLFLEFHGSDAGVKEQAERMAEVCGEFGGDNFSWTSNTEERDKLWAARHNAAYSAIALKPGASVMATDVCVPVSKLAECILATKQDVDDAGIVAPIVGHVGDGNFHVQLLIHPDTREEDIRVCSEINRKLVERAIAMDGTCTGEHGVGQGKMKYLEAEHGEALNVMRTIKMAFDPQNIMNPGKMLPPSD
ncbi:MAG: FAD-binding protein [Rhodospirillaceae bacterium]|jgi:D-lactate dehydrogenase (cytochrome)|nr:FAD-binding protein [Rhodospirillaceae bacterium]MBT4588396.1 FAD-binding protein [Rhodospirillaceae bacterium]MBT4940762.1 FAD-binding protein [Rhodospirillaceae bacterium]MBT5939433.1 FAD-binding protein [Rhodospirillaceae bacterium]MBT7267456.1 FAD-binding protein [Rhodospirillaceae bacterium]